MVVETIGKTVYKKMVQVCMAFEDIAASAASRSSGLDRKMRCRRTNHAAMVTLTKTIGMTVVATSLVRKKYKETTQDKTRLHRCQEYKSPWRAGDAPVMKVRVKDAIQRENRYVKADKRQASQHVCEYCW